MMMSHLDYYLDCITPIVAMEKHNQEFLNFFSWGLHVLIVPINEAALYCSTILKLKLGCNKLN